MEKIKIAFCGNRGHLRYAMQGIKLMKDEVIAAGVSADGGDDPLKVQAIVEAAVGYPVPVFSDPVSMMDAVQPDIMVVNGAFDTHASLSIAALERNIHVFCEKPIALTLDELEAVRRAWQNAAPGTTIASMVGLRCESPMRTAWEAVRDGAIGKVKMVSSRKSYKLGSRAQYYRSRASYGGTIPWVGSHALDLMIYFGGAGFDNIFAYHNSEDNCGHGDLEVCAVCCGRLTNGVITSCTIDYLRPQAAPTHGDDRVRVAGTTGVIEVAKDRVVLLDSTGEHELPLIPERELFYDFVHQIFNGETPIVTSEETIELTRACLLARDFADQQ